MKLHRRVIRLDGVAYPVLSLRPGEQARFATNRAHETWHVLSDSHGGRLLGRLLWGLAYQRVPNTLVLIDRTHLDPNPFDAEPSDPVVLTSSTLTPLTPQAARQLRRLTPLRSRPDGTVGWSTHGLDQAVEAHQQWRAAPAGERERPWEPEIDTGKRCTRLGGVLLFAAPPALLKQWAWEVYTLADEYWNEQSASELTWPDGEVQLWRQYHRMVSAARTARRDLLADPSSKDLRREQIQELLWLRSEEYRRRMLPQGCGMSK
jgi:hypothetical protein